MKETALLFGDGIRYFLFLSLSVLFFSIHPVTRGTPKKIRTKPKTPFHPNF